MTTLPGRLVRPLQPRDPQEQHRGATPLELFTDLCFVVAIAQAAAELHHAISADHAADGWVHFSMAFFAIWWAWLNFTWLSSAYDNDDLIQRLLTILQIVGSLVLAAGIPRMFEDDLVLGVTGYVVMRVALVAQWVRVSIHDPDHRATARRYAGGVLVVQLGWIGFLFVPQEMLLTCFAVGVIAELAVPVWAERPAMTPWHPHHIAERYGLFFIIVLGETVLSTTLAIQEALDLDEPAPEVAYVVAGGILIVFSMWWLYFARSAGVVLETSQRPLHRRLIHLGIRPRLHLCFRRSHRCRACRPRGLLDPPQRSS